MPDLLIELFSEEIPARMQGKAAADLKRLVTDGLVEAGLTYASAGAFHTPRRLALSVEGLSSASPDTREDRKGPKVGAPDKAIEGFCRGAGVDRTALEVRDTGKAQVYFAVIEHKGRPAPEIVAQVLDHTVRHFPWPKSMRWGTGSLRWVRPLHSILCILADDEGAETVPLQIDGITAGNTTRGHRFMAPDAFAVTSFEDYEAKLKQARVLLRAEERADHIRQEAANLAFAAGLELVEDPGLLAEVAGLVEWPVVLMGEIDADFLHLPPEVLQTSMKEHQKFFSLRDKTRADHPVRHRRQHRRPRWRQDHPRGQPEGAGRAAGGREILLGKRPARGHGGDAGLVRRSGGGDLSRQAGQPGRAGRPHRRAGPRDRAAGGGRRRIRQKRPRASPRPTCAPKWWASFPSCRASWGAITRWRPGATRPSPTPAATTGNPWARTTTCPPRRSRSPWRWPTSWTR